MTTYVNTPMSTNRRLAIGCLALAVIFFCIALAVLAGVLYSRTAAGTTGNGSTDGAPYVATPGTFQGEVAAYAVTAANGWPIDFGENRTMTVQAPANQDLVVNYGREGFAANGTQVQVCGTALVPAGSKLDLVLWAGNAEAVTKGYGLEYANFTYNNRTDPVNGDSKCQAWEQVMATAP